MERVVAFELNGWPQTLPTTAGATRYVAIRTEATTSEGTRSVHPSESNFLTAHNSSHGEREAASTRKLSSPTRKLDQLRFACTPVWDRHYNFVNLASFCVLCKFELATCNVVRISVASWSVLVSCSLTLYTCSVSVPSRFLFHD